MSTKAPRTKFKKASCAPKRFKSAFMFYSAKRHKEIRQELGDSEKIRAADVAKLVSKSWKQLGPLERAEWEEMARVDKERYEREKALYKGPWKVPDIKYPDGPKKPMSAFLAFGNERRKAIADANPLLSNAEISSMLSKLWKECPPDVKQAYRDREAREREIFKRYRAEWERKKHREAGVEIPSEKVDRPVDEKQHQLHGQQQQQRFGHSVDGLFGRNFQNVTKSVDLTNTSDNNSKDDWDEWMSGSDVESKSSESDAATSPVDKADIMDAATIMGHRPPQLQYPFYPWHAAGTLFLPHLPIRQILSLEGSSLEALLDDEELFEDFSPHDVITTAPFVDHAEIDSDFSGIVSV